MKTLGDKLRLLRSQKSWSQEDMAHELNISLPAYSKIERGITDVSFSRLEQIADLFGLTLVELLNYGSESDTDLYQYKKLLEEKDQEIMRLQRKVIELLEQVNKN